MNKFTRHIWLIPEDDANRQIANGFIHHHEVNENQIKIMPPAGGWVKVLEQFKDEYIQVLRNNQNAHLVMVIDFDNRYANRFAEFNNSIPEDIKSRVFVIGGMTTPEKLKKELGLSFEKIGELLAKDCCLEDFETWNHAELKHNEAERRRLTEIVRPILFRLRGE